MSNDIYTEVGRLEAIREMEKELANADFDMTDFDLEDEEFKEGLDELEDDFEFDPEDDGLNEADYMYY